MKTNEKQKVEKSNKTTHTGIAKLRWVKLNESIPPMSILVDGVKSFGC